LSSGQTWAADGTPQIESGAPQVASKVLVPTATATVTANVTPTTSATAAGKLQLASNDVLADVQFDPGFLMGQSVDVTRFEHGNTVLPGTYSVDVTINQNPGGHAEISFIQKDSTSSAQPCLTLSLLDSLGVNTSPWPALPATNTAESRTTAPTHNWTAALISTAGAFGIAPPSITTSMAEPTGRHSIPMSSMI